VGYMVLGAEEGVAEEMRVRLAEGFARCTRWAGVKLCLGWRIAVGLVVVGRRVKGDRD
jgi:hypothetical protein